MINGIGIWQDGSLKLIEPGTPETGERYIFKEESKIPYIPAGNVSVVVFDLSGTICFSKMHA